MFLSKGLRLEIVNLSTYFISHIYINETNYLCVCNGKYHNMTFLLNEYKNFIAHGIIKFCHLKLYVFTSSIYMTYVT